MTNKLYRKLVVRIVLVIALVIAMAITTYAYVNSVLFVQKNVFTTGLVDIVLVGNAQNGNLVAFHDPSGNDIKLIEPGGTYIAEFTVKNQSSDEGGVHYRLYFDGIEGNYLAEILQVDIIRNGNIIKTGKMSDFGRDAEAFSILGIGESAELTMMLRYPSEEGNEGQGLTIENFTLLAEAVQTKNNPDGAFESE